MFDIFEIFMDLTTPKYLKQENNIKEWQITLVACSWQLNQWPMLKSSFTLWQQRHNYRPQWSCEGYAFTGICLSTGRVGVSASVHAGIPPPEQTPPPGADTPQEQTPPRADTPLEQTPPGADTPLPQQHLTPQSRHPLEQTPPWEQTPPEIWSLLRTVRILLECILVFIILMSSWNGFFM